MLTINNFFTNTVSILSVIIIFWGCQKEKIIVPNSDTNLFGKAKVITITGRVVNNNDLPVSGATVSSGDRSSMTDIFGVFSLENTEVAEKLGFVEVQKAGFLNGYRSFVPSGNSHHVVIKLLLDSKIGEFKSGQGGTLSSQGVKISFSAGSYMKNNTVYEGDVNVAMQYINPDSEDFTDEMPGGLIAVEDSRIQGLTSFGMVSVTLSDDSGEKIELGKGNTAQVTFPLSTKLQNIAPSQIRLWYFDENKGYWIPEGNATLENGKYVGSVSHFSSWNVDKSWDPVDIQMQINLGSGEHFVNSILDERNDPTYRPAQGAKVIIKSESGVHISGYTNSSGYFNDMLPLNEKLDLTIQVNCGSIGFSDVYNAQIGPFLTSTTLQEIKIENPDGSTIITGSIVDCNNNPLFNGYIVANGLVYMLDKGLFSFLDCGTSVSIKPYSLPVWSTDDTQNFTLTGDSLNVGSIQLCNNADSTSVKDFDGNDYRTVKIGNQTWMAENLRTTHFNNGDEILNITSNLLWSTTTNAAWSNYENKIENDSIYGKLYNGYTISNSQNVCPVGWHIPTESEYNILSDSLGINQGGSKMKSIGTIQEGNGLWLTNQGATNETGFTGHPGGWRNHYGDFLEQGWVGVWFTVRPGDSETYVFNLWGGSPGLGVWGFGAFKEYGNSVRCMKD